MHRLPLPSHSTPWQTLGAAMAAALLAGAWSPPSGAQAAAPDGAPAAGGAPVVAPAGAAPAQAPSGAVPAAVPRPARGAPSGPHWSALTAKQRAALAPLAPHWSGLTEAHKRKWMAMTKDFPDLSPQEQERMHSRMASWAALSPRQRAQARFNFEAARERLSPDTRKELWESYQALSSDEKHRLAAAAPRTPVKGMATLAHTPAAAPPPVRLAPSPARAAPDAAAAGHAPVARVRIQHNTLLPERAVPALLPQAAPAPPPATP
ncbi:MAG: DUF3106 domain-containing protein [Xylophilus ampelinus]